MTGEDTGRCSIGSLGAGAEWEITRMRMIPLR
jgi:hypothetical protein